MKSQLAKSGVELLKTLGKYADLIMEIYLKREVPSSYDDESVLEKLVTQHILWRPSGDEGLHLTKAVRNLLEQALKDERNRQIDGNIGNTLASVKTLIGHYKEASAHHRRHDSDEYLKEIGELVFGMMESLHHNLGMLWSHIHNEFALVATLAAKIRENKLAQEQAKSVLTCLEMFDFKELSELAGGDRALRRLLVVRLQHEVETCADELREVQERLLNMLGSFRKIELRSKLVRGFDLFLDQHPDYLPPCYPEHPHLNAFFNQIQPIKISAGIDVTVAEQEEFYIELIQTLAIPADAKNISSDRKASSIEIENNPTKFFVASPEEQALENFFCLGCGVLAVRSAGLFGKH